MGKHPGGRPTKLTPEIVEQAKKHLTTFDVSIGTLLPTVEGLALDLKISRDTIYEWAKENAEFSDIVEELRARQGQKLIQNSILNRYNSTIAKLILSGKHGYVEQSEVNNKLELVKPILGGATKEDKNALHSDDSNS